MNDSTQQVNCNDYLGWVYENGRWVSVGTYDPADPFGDAVREASENEMARSLSVLHAPGSVWELRCIDIGEGRRPPIAGFYNNPWEAATAAKLQEYSGTYTTLNVIREVNIHRGGVNRANKHTKDEGVITRQWLLLDIDIEREVKGIAASQAEIDVSWVLACQIRDRLVTEGWCQPVEALSANGIHMLWPINLEARIQGNTELVKSWLGAMARLGTAMQSGAITASVDCSVSNPGQITKLYGSYVGKGGNTPERPHRYSRLIHVPAELDWSNPERPVISEEMIQAAIESVDREFPPEAAAGNPNQNGRDRSSGSRQNPNRQNPRANSPRLNVAKWLEDRGVEYRVVEEENNTKYIIECPFDESHSPAAILQYEPSGATHFNCFHNSCSEYKWADARDEIGAPEPHHKEGGGSSGFRNRNQRRRASDNTYFYNLAVTWWLDAEGYDPDTTESGDGTQTHVLNKCPMEGSAHENGEAAFVEGAKGQAGFRCSSPGCKQRNNWRDWRDVIEKMGVPDAEHWDGEPAELRPKSQLGNASGSSGGSNSGGRQDDRENRKWKVQKYADVAPEEIHWLWPGRLPKGKLVVFSGDAGVGKSVMLVDLAARVTRGLRWPDGAEVPRGNVIYVSSEDALADTMVPRFMAARGDRGRMYNIVPPDGSLSLDRDIPELRDIIEQDPEICMIVLDPITAMYGETVNENRNADIRRVLTPLTQMAEDTGVCIVANSHFGKSKDHRALHKTLGSVALPAHARITFGVLRHPNNEDRIIMAPQKSNHRDVYGLAYSVEPWPENPEIPRVIWEPEPVYESLDELVQQGRGGKPAERVAAAEEWLIANLLVPTPAGEVKRQATAGGISKRTLARAKRNLNIQSTKEGYGDGGTWMWHPPREEIGGLHRGRRTEQPQRTSRPDFDENFDT